MKRAVSLLICLTFLSLICSYLAYRQNSKTDIPKETSNKSIGLFRIIQIQNKKHGYIDKTGEIVILPQFDEAGDFSEGIASVAISQKVGCIDRTGKNIWDPQK